MMDHDARAIGEYATNRTKKELRALVEITNRAWSPDLDATEQIVWGVLYANISRKGWDEASRWKLVWKAAKRNVSLISAWDATLNAMLATYTRDHIGQHGYTQAHYDLLMEPWIEWVGEMEGNE